MKTIILTLFLSLNIFAQREFLLLMQDDGINYNGTELITNEIDRTLEPTAVYSSNFSANVDGWQAFNGAAAGNIDGISGLDNNLRYTVDATTNAHFFRRNSTIPITNRYAVSINYYVPSTNAALDGFGLFYAGTQYFGGLFPATKDSWGLYKLNTTNATVATEIRIYTYDGEAQTYGSGNGDLFYVGGFNISRIGAYTGTGNHITDSSSTYKQVGNYSLKITASAAGNGTTNTVSLASTLFTAVTSGTNYRFQLYAYTSTANTTLTFKLGDIVKTAIVSTVGMSVINFDFKATASTTGNILLYLDKAATVYIDEVSLKSGQ